MNKTLLLVISLFAGISPVYPAIAEVVNIAVAANFTDAMHRLIPVFEENTGHTAKVSYASTGKLYAQIQHGAPFEIYLAADTARPVRAIKSGLAVDGARFVYARGKVVLWSAHSGLFNDGMAFLKSGDYKHLAMANPKTAPYGKAAQEVMEHLGIWETRQQQIVRGDSIAQAFQFAVTGNVDAGFVALSQVKAWKDSNTSLWEIPQSYYSPIEQSAVLLKKGEKNPAAKAFMRFLQSQSAKKIIAGLGYGVE